MARVCMDVQHSPVEVMKTKYIHMSILIQGPKQPGNNINLYLELLKEDLEMLWNSPVKTWDAFEKEYFYMKVAVLTTVHDYLSLRICIRPGVPWILRMHEVHG